MLLTNEIFLDNNICIGDSAFVESPPGRMCHRL